MAMCVYGESGLKSRMLLMPSDAPGNINQKPHVNVSVRTFPTYLRILSNECRSTMDTTLGDDLLDLRASELVRSVLDPQCSVTRAPEPDSKQLGFEIRNIDWVACKDFTVSGGKTQIEEYMSTWEVEPRWLFSVEFVQESELEFEKQFHYRALWSMPTRRRPVAHSTACVSFTISLSKSKPPTTPVLVTFQLESSQTVHTPGKTRFREKWLKDVIESKALLMDTITF
ncbi:A-kinase anchor protein 14 [Pangasianodon hypophthalmus]|uniref:A-kinase anchor protein 14 n=1 Tax=Pangasianodon hypophthalmus TaxID=310915 RepID=UPI002307CA30|nr:A-kinase anchor protein 14 [Pangasianodon hypophthalmus]